VKVKFATPAGRTVSDDLPAIKISHGISRFTVDGNLDHCAPARPFAFSGGGFRRVADVIYQSPHMDGNTRNHDQRGWRSPRLFRVVFAILPRSIAKNSRENCRAIKVT